MRDRTDASRRGGALRRRATVVAALSLLLAVTACSEDDSSEAEEDQPEGQNAEELLGPEDPASGDPVRIGMVSDGSTEAFDNTDELRAAEATAAYWNEHRGGIGGRPVEVVPCETGATPAGASDCTNTMVQEDVVAVALSQSAVGAAVWEGMHAADIPIMLFQTSGEEVVTDEESTFVLASPLSTFYGLPISVAESEETDKIAFVIIDVPQALGILEEGAGPQILEDAGIEHEVVTVPPGTADMTSQMQQVADSGAGVTHVIGNDAFCIAAFNGLNTVGYEGAVTSISQCITDSTREGAAPEVLDGMYLTATSALGATDDPTYQTYQAVMSSFGEDVEDVDNALAMGGYVSMGALLTSLAEIEGEITTETVVETIKSMPEEELPGGGGVTFRCGGSAVESQPAVCSSQWLRTQLDTEGQPSGYEPIDSTDLLS